MIVNNQDHHVIVRRTGFIRGWQRRGELFTPQLYTVDMCQQRRQFVRWRHAVYPFSRLSFQRNANMSAAENHRCSPLPVLFQHIVGHQQVIRIGLLSLISQHHHPITRQAGFEKMVQWRITYCQPAARASQSFNTLFQRILCAIKRNTQRKLAPHSRLGIDGNIPIHHADQFFTDRQTKSRSLEITLYASPHLEERIEQPNHLFGRDPYTRITHSNAQVVAAALHVQHNTTGIGKLDCVTQ